MTPLLQSSPPAPGKQPISTKSNFPSPFKSPKAVAENLTGVKFCSQVEFSIKPTLLAKIKLIKKIEIHMNKRIYVFFHHFYKK